MFPFIKLKKRGDKLFGSKKPYPYLCNPLAKKWRVGQGVKTPPFHGGITGSNPVRATKSGVYSAFFGYP